MSLRSRPLQRSRGAPPRSALSLHGLPEESGSAFTVYALWPAEALEISGEVSTYDRRGFCPRCGSRLLDTSDAGGELVEIRIGSLDDAPFGLTPQSETWVKRRESWLPPVEGATQHDES